jgi:type IV pilus assembly protein PilC
MADKKAEQILTFVYEGTDRRGQKIKGEASGKNVSLVKAQLRKQGINAQRVSKKTANPLAGLTGKKKISPMDVAIFTRQLATMMRAGVPLVQAFEIVAEGLDNPSMREVVLGIKADVEAGNNFGGALRKYPQHFDDLYCSLVSSGEQSGALEGMLDRVAQYKEKSELLKQKIKKAMKYPLTVISVAIGVTILLLLKVVPVFQDLFSSFGAELPAFTQMVINLSKWMQVWWWLVLIVIVGTVVGFTEARSRVPAFSNRVDEMILKLPIVGDLALKSTVARFCRTLSTTFAAGVPLIDALVSCAGATGNNVYRQAVLRVRDDVATGQQLQFAMRQTGVFPSMALQMVAIGEESGALDSMLDKVATYYENEVDNAVDGLTAMMEPLIMVVLGVLVGGLVVAMYLPIFQLGSVV